MARTSAGGHKPGKVPKRIAFQTVAAEPTLMQGKMAYTAMAPYLTTAEGVQIVQIVLPTSATGPMHGLVGGLVAETGPKVLGQGDADPARPEHLLVELQAEILSGNADEANQARLGRLAERVEDAGLMSEAVARLDAAGRGEYAVQLRKLTAMNAAWRMEERGDARMRRGSP